MFRHTKMLKYMLELIMNPLPSKAARFRGSFTPGAYLAQETAVQGIRRSSSTLSANWA